MITAIYPGTYDPVTNGHLDIIRRAASIFDRVVVGVVREPHHKVPLFTVEERVDFVREALVEVANVEVDVFAELVVAFARRWEAKVIAEFGGNVDELVPPAVALRFRDMFPEGKGGAPTSPQE